MPDWRNWDGEDWVMAFLAVTLGPAAVLACLFVLFMVLGLPFYLWDKAHSPPEETFALPKEAWHCGQSHTTTVTTYVMIGKVMTPITTNVEECIAWVKN